LNLVRNMFTHFSYGPIFVRRQEIIPQDAGGSKVSS